MDHKMAMICDLSAPGRHQPKLQ